MENPSSSTSSDYLNLKFRIEKQLEAFKVVASFSPQLSPQVLIHNLEQVIEEGDGSKIDNAGQPPADFQVREFKMESALVAQLNNFKNRDGHHQKIMGLKLKSWEKACLTLIGHLIDEKSINCQSSLKESLEGIKNRLADGHYETPMDFHSEMLTTLKTVHLTPLDPTTFHVNVIWSAYVENQSMIQMLTDYKEKSGEALTVFKFDPKMSRTSGSLIGEGADGIENPFTELRLMQADQFLVRKKDGSRFVFECLICKIPLKFCLSKSRFHVLRVHFLDRYQCARCSQKFYKTADLHRHKLSPCQVKKKPMKKVDDVVGAKKNVSRPVTNKIASESKVLGLIRKSKGKFKCLVCRVATFGTRFHATRHIRGVHFRERKYFCKICGKGFSYLYCLRNHDIACQKKQKRTQQVSTLTLPSGKNDQ